jgi:hypothetical protein
VIIWLSHQKDEGILSFFTVSSSWVLEIDRESVSDGA